MACKVCNQMPICLC